jgi:hypothetical protein
MVQQQYLTKADYTADQKSIKETLDAARAEQTQRMNHMQATLDGIDTYLREHK